MSEDLTDRQRQVLGFINQFRDWNQCNPCSQEIADHFGWASPNASSDHLLALERRGAILFRKKHEASTQRRARGYVVLSPYDAA
jgi:SOS-response transcriptional repressor LexA